MNLIKEVYKQEKEIIGNTLIIYEFINAHTMKEAFHKSMARGDDKSSIVPM